MEVRTQCRMGWSGGTYTVLGGVGWSYAHRVGWVGGTHTVSDGVECRYVYGFGCGRVELRTPGGVGWRYAHSVGWGGVEVRIRFWVR